MGDWPRTYSGDSAPGEALAIASEVMPLLLAGDEPALAVLREQYAHARVDSAEMSGAGFFVNYAVPPDLPTTMPLNITGADARLRIAGLEHGAGCVVFVRGGRLKVFEVFSYAGDWPENARLLDVGSVSPLQIPG